MHATLEPAANVYRTAVGPTRLNSLTVAWLSWVCYLVLAAPPSKPGSCRAFAAGGPLRTICDPSSFSALAYVPQGKHSEPLPVLLYLHGMGQSGNNLSKMLEPPATGSPVAELHHGRALNELKEAFVTVAPQTNRGWQPQVLGAFVDFLFMDGQDALGVQLDPSRVYITGHSIGGTAALQAAAEVRSSSGKPRFAASAPVAPSFLRTHHNLVGIPVWLHHGANDIVVPVDASDHAEKMLRVVNPGRDMVRYSKYEEAPTAPGRNPETHGGHASPILAYQNPELYSWLLSHRLTEF